MKLEENKPIALAVAVYAAASLTAMAPMSLGAAAVLLAFLWARPGVSVISSPSTRRYWLWAGVVALSWVASLIGLKLWPYLTPGFEASQVQWAQDLAKLWYFAWAPLLGVMIAHLSERAERRVWRTWLVVYFVLSCVGIAQFFTGWPRPQGIPGLAGHYHATIFLGHHLSTSSVWIFPFFASLAGVFSAPLRARFGLSRSFLVVATVVGGVTLVLTFSRMLWLALPVGLLVFGILKFVLAPTGRTRGALVKNLSLLVAAGFVALFLAWQVPAIHDRMLNAMGTNERFELWQANWDFFKARPWTGVGRGHNLEIAGQYLRAKHPGADVFIGHAHNNLFDVMGSMGILGLAAWLGFNFWIVSQLFQLASSQSSPPWQRDLCTAWLACFLVLHLNGLTNLNFWEGKVMHQLFWMLAWLLAWSKKRAAFHFRGPDTHATAVPPQA